VEVEQAVAPEEAVDAAFAVAAMTVFVAGAGRGAPASVGRESAIAIAIGPRRCRRPASASSSWN
jgi:hypothetical protein